MPQAIAACSFATLDAALSTPGCRKRKSPASRRRSPQPCRGREHPGFLRCGEYRQELSAGLPIGIDADGLLTEKNGCGRLLPPAQPPAISSKKRSSARSWHGNGGVDQRIPQQGRAGIYACGGSPLRVFTHRCATLSCFSCSLARSPAAARRARRVLVTSVRLCPI